MGLCSARHCIMGSPQQRQHQSHQHQCHNSLSITPMPTSAAEVLREPLARLDCHLRSSRHRPEQPEMLTFKQANSKHLCLISSGAPFSFPELQNFRAPAPLCQKCTVADWHTGLLIICCMCYRCYLNEWCSITVS